MKIGSIVFQNGYAYSVDDNLFIGLVDKSEKLEIRNCTIVGFSDNGQTEIKIADVEGTFKVDSDILGYKKRHINMALLFNFETNSFLTTTERYDRMGA